MLPENLVQNNPPFLSSTPNTPRTNPGILSLQIAFLPIPRMETRKTEVWHVIATERLPGGFQNTEPDVLPNRDLIGASTSRVTWFLKL